MKSKLLFFTFALTQTLSAQTFTEASPAPEFTGVYGSSIAFSDVDGDGDDDLLITGRNDSEETIAKLYINDGGSFTEDMDTPFEGGYFSAIAFSDVDGDGDSDLMITGTNGPEVIAKLYTNDGGNFTEVIGTPFVGVYSSSIAFSDVDGDEDDDLIITGMNDSGERITRLYTNVGGNFTEVTGTPFEGVDFSSIAFSDVDDDGDNDLIITGRNNSTKSIAKLYINNGGNFTEVMDTPFVGVFIGSIAFSDVDDDGDNDLMITGLDDSIGRIAKLYTNDGGNFTEVMDTPFEGVIFSSITFSDVDNDGDNDLVIVGENSLGNRIAKLYTNDGGSFNETLNTPFEGMVGGSIAFSDVDSDGDNDLVITGATGLSGAIAKLYINEEIASSTNELKIENSLELLSFPNPSTSSVLSLQYNGEERGPATIKVYNINGVLLQQQSEFIRGDKQIFPINIKSLSKGSYLIELNIDKKRGTAKFIVQ